MWSEIARRPVAPLWKRLIAGTIDSLPFLAVAPLFLRALERGEEAPGENKHRNRFALQCSRRPSLWWSVLIRAAHALYEVWGVSTSGQTFGQRGMGIRVVTQECQRGPTLRQAALRWALASIPDALVPLLIRFPNDDHFLTALSELEPEVEELRHQYGRDRQGMNEALLALYKDRDLNPLKACLPSLLPVCMSLLARCVLHAPALIGPLHQSLHDRAARTIIVEDRRRSLQVASSDGRAQEPPPARADNR